MKKIVVFILTAILFGFQGCKPAENRYKIIGAAEGTTYSIVYYAAQPLLTGGRVDSLLAVFEASCSIYDSSSLISRLNRNETDSVDTNIADCIELARKVSEQGDGLYDITIKALTDAWGFNAGAGDSIPNIDSLLHIVGIDKIEVRDGKLIKRDPRIQIDLNSVAKGYSVDLIASYIQSLGIQNFVVEIGGEVYASGLLPTGTRWRVGIDKPFDGNFYPGEYLQEIVTLENEAMATSGNYRRNRIDGNGKRVHHTIDPKTGLSAENTMLSASVVAATCAEADAYATLFMVVGIDKAREILARNPQLGACLIYADGDSDSVFVTRNMESRIVKK